MSSLESDVGIIKTLRLANFRHTLADSRLLLGLFRNRKKISYPFKGKFDSKVRNLTDDEAEALLRGALIICITAIETYIESFIDARFRNRLIDAKKPEDIDEAFNATYDSWRLTENPANPKYAKAWAGSEWKKVVFNKFKNDVKTFNTPSPGNINKLFKLYCGIPNILGLCSWAEVTSESVKTTLEDLIELRGNLVHKGKKILGDTPILSEKEVSQAIDFSENLIKYFEKAVPG